MKRRMVLFECAECGHEFEELIIYDDEGNPDETPGCEKCSSESCAPTEDIRKRLHRDGDHYKHISWSLHHAGD